MTKRGNGRTASPGTRQMILRLLKQHGSLDSTKLAETLGVSVMAVRQHLYGLREQKLVSAVEQPRPMGRPAKMWSLTAASAPHFPDAHAQFTVNLLGAAEEALGKRGMKRMLSQCAQRQIANYRSRMPARASLQNQLERLISMRNEEGFMAEVQPEPDGSFLLIENHCAIGAAASACCGLCDSEAEVFKAVLGENVVVDRTEHMMGGSRRCVYRIRRAGVRNRRASRAPLNTDTL